DKGQLAGGEGGRNQHVGGGEVCVDLAAAVALAAVVARRPPVQRPREDREACRDARDVQAVGRLLDEQLVAAGEWRRQEHPVRLVRKALPAAEDSDEPVYLVVVRRDVV